MITGSRLHKKGNKMKYKIDHDYHIHSHLSSCSRHPEQTKENILKYAKAIGLSSICMTDHFWDEKVDGASNWYAQNYSHIAESLPLPEDDGVRFLFGCECDIDRHMTLGLSEERFDKFDFIVIPTTHLHMKGFTVVGDEDSSTRARLWSERFDSLLSKRLPFRKVGIAHLACTLTDPRSYEDYLVTLSLIKDADMHDLFCRAARAGVGIELNASDMQSAKKNPDEVFRMFRIAKDAGCKFYLGSDSHTPQEFNGLKETFEYAIDALGLTEEDKFRIEDI